MSLSQKHRDFIEREKKQAKSKRAKAKQLVEEAELHEANAMGRRRGRPRLSLINLLLTFLGLIALLLVSALVLTTYLNAL